jgi:hypothetical protein
MFEDIVNIAATDQRYKHLFPALERLQVAHFCKKHAVLMFRTAPDQPDDLAKQIHDMLWNDCGTDWDVRALAPGETAQGCADAPDHAEPIHQLHTFADAVRFISSQRMVELELALERMKVLHYSPNGELVYIASEELPRDLVRTLKPLLEEETGIEWRIRASAEIAPVESLSERRKREEARALEELKRQPFIAEALKHFPNSEIVAVRQPVDEAGADVVPMPQPKAAPAHARKKEAEQ